jgi:hypothetical protein
MTFQLARAVTLVVCSSLFFSGPILGLGSTLGSTLGSSVIQDQPVTTLPCSRVMTFTPTNWLNQFSSNTSEAGQDQAALHWANCKQASNLKLLRNSPQRKARLLKLNRLETDFIAYETELGFLVAGGGTIHPHGQARFNMDLQMHLEQLIKLTASNAGAVQSTSLNARYQQAKATLEARVKRVQTPKPFTESLSKTEAANLTKQWTVAAKKYAKSVRDIQAIIGPRIDAVGVLEMEFLATGLWAEEL